MRFSLVQIIRMRRRNYYRLTGAILLERISTLCDSWQSTRLD